MGNWTRTASNKTKLELPHYCNKCKRDDVFLEYHHIIPYSLLPCSGKWNIVQLCHNCHVEVHRLYRNMKYDEFLKFVVSRLKVHPAMTYFMTDDELEECEKILHAIERLQKYRKENKWWVRDCSHAAQAIADIDMFRYGCMKEKA